MPLCFFRISEDSAEDETNSASNQPAFNVDYLGTSLNLAVDELSNSENDYGLWIGSKKEETVQGFNLYVQQFDAIIIKRIINTLRNKALIISQLVIPLVILTINLIYLKYGPIKNEESPALKIDIQRYANNFVPYQLLNSNAILKNISQFYSNQFKITKNTRSFELNDTTIVNTCLNKRQNIDEFLGCLGALDIYSITDKYIVASTFDIVKGNLSIIGHFNNQAFHTVPLALNVINNALFKYFSSANNSITVINHPLPRTVVDEVTDLQFKAITGML
jgi:ATP-binding cassette subfamily A (ABC1) protein 3